VCLSFFYNFGVSAACVIVRLLRKSEALGAHHLSPFYFCCAFFDCLKILNVLWARDDGRVHNVLPAIPLSVPRAGSRTPRSAALKMVPASRKDGTACRFFRLSPLPFLSHSFRFPFSLFLLIPGFPFSLKDQRSGLTSPGCPPNRTFFFFTHHPSGILVPHPIPISSKGLKALIPMVADVLSSLQEGSRPVS